MKGIKKAFRNCSGAFDQVLEKVGGQEDADRLLSYYTKQEVLFLDAKLGITFRFIQLSIVAFIIGYMFIYKQGYMKVESAKGATVTHVSGDAFAVSSGQAGERYFSADELTQPGLENGNIFVATRQTVHKQMRGYCEDPDMPCMSDADCTPLGEGVCTEKGLCKEHSWCNVEKEPEIYEMESDKVQIWARSFIQFVQLAPEKLFTTEWDHPGPKPETTFTVRQLLLMCEPIPVNYEEVAELGAVFEVQFKWDCKVGADQCKPAITTRRLDTTFDPDNIGYAFSITETIDGDNRLQNAVRGLRFFFRTSGTGKKVSVSATITVASMSATLLSFAIVIADLLLTKVFALRLKYIARKFENTPDFSEYMQQREERLVGATQESDIDKAEREVEMKEKEWLVKFQEDDR